MYQDFTSRDYWQSLMDAYRQMSPSEITSFSSDERGTDIVFVQEVPRSELPAIARSVVPSDMVITRTQHFDPFDHARNRAKGSYAASIPRGPGRFGGQYFHRHRHRQPVEVGQRLQGVDPVDRRRARGPDPAPHQVPLRRRGAVRRPVDREAPLSGAAAERGEAEPPQLLLDDVEFPSAGAANA